MNLRRGGRSVLLVAAATFALCEAASFLALSWLRPAASLPIYEDQTVSDGRVTPVRANLNHRWRSSEFDVTIRINSGGYRKDFEFSLVDVEFAFMGDSFTFGHGVEVSERFTNLFAS